MWHIEGLLHLRACVESIQRNSLRCAYFVEWDNKLEKAVPLKSSTRQYRAFQSFAVFCTLIIQPIFFLRCYQIAKWSSDMVPPLSYYSAVTGTILLVMVLPYLWFFAKDANVLKFITFLYQIIKLDKQFHDLLPIIVITKKPRNHLGNLTNLGNLLTLTINYTSPAIITLISFSENAPVYGFIIYALSVAISGVVVFRFWNNILLKKDVSFQKTIQIYKQLKLMTILVQEIGHNLVSMCLHHAYCVIISTMAMYHFILQFTKGNQVSVLVTLPTVLTFLLATGFEMLAICEIAKATTASKEILRKLLTNHENDKYRRRVVRSLLPNSISLEFVDSVDTIRNGIGMVYFLRYADRVQSYTSTWLLATKHNQ
ncbi:hypothetical protein Fcan01_16880 [Folsomia candida]|uniref:Uncharacterized protein n=1 Tax=Folsomia candida TaxID=158441 RepID=A0A226DTZ1_FOLCA|nr:hypothetical protein Fcan01_16880 [Folsomia candida]